MFGHHESAQAKVLYAQDVTGGWEDVHHVKIEFVLEVRPPAGQAFRAKATHHFIMFEHYPQVGDVVNVKYNPKSLEAVLDLKDDIRYGDKRLKHDEQAQRQAGQARRDALLSAPPGTPLSSAGGARRNHLAPKTQEAMKLLEEAQRRLNQVPGGAGMADSDDPEMQELLEQAQAFERRAKQGAPANSAGGALDPELQELMEMEEAERQAKLAREQQAARGGQMPAGFPGVAAPTNPQAAMGPAEMDMLRRELEYTGASGQAKILRKQQAGAPVQHLTPFFVEVQVQPDAMGFPFTASFTTWIDTSRGALMEGYMLPVKYDPQNTARIVFLLPA